MRPLAAVALVPVIGCALAACSSPRRTPELARPAAATPLAPPSPDAGVPIPTVHARRPVAEAPHAGAIQTLALSPDGAIAISADELGGIRLWPALDGTKEPRIVDMPAPEQLAVGARAGGVFGAALDEAGGLYLAKLDGEGRQLSHVSLPGDPAVTGMTMTSRGLLAWRADQTVALIDVDGVVRGRIATDPGQRLVVVAASATRAVALVERAGGKRQLRWLALAPVLAWGAWIDVMGDLDGEVSLALAPGNQRIAALLRTEKVARAAVFDVANGTLLASPAPTPADTAIGFADDDHVVLGGLDHVSWLDLTATTPRAAPVVPRAPKVRARAMFAAGAGRAVTAMNGELVLSTPTTTQFLGYETVSPRIAEVGPEGSLVVGVADHLLVLDKDLRGAAAPLAGVSGTVATLRWLGEDDWLVESAAPGDTTLQIALVAGAGGSPTVVRTGLPEVQVLHYEPSTQLVTLSFGASSEVAHFDRAHHRLDRVARIAKPSPYEQVLFIPVSPALAHGIQLVQVSMRDRSTIKWLRDPRALDKPSATATIDGPFAGADAAGHVFAWRDTASHQLELALYAGGTLLHTLPTQGAVALWPDPRGTRYVTTSATSVAMYDLDGKQLWFQQLATAQEALWLTDGALAITSAGGVARLDPATGAVTAARCGWRFSLAAKPHPATPRVEPLCAQL